jgi:peptide-methionine (R)-S-oxide reductase
MNGEIQISRLFVNIRVQNQIYMKRTPLIFSIPLIFGILVFSMASCMAQQQDEKKNPYYSETNKTKLTVSEAQWKKVLSPTVYNIMREKGTEPSNTGPYVQNPKKGMYYCTSCGNPLFSSDTKFDSHTGWPSFYQSLGAGSVLQSKDNSMGMERDEVLCTRCGGHLGHVFDDGPAPTHLRYCMNGYALMFEATK